MSFWLSLILPVILVFKNYFLPVTLFGGDAPYFYPEAFPDLLNPSVWTERGVAFGGTNQLLWLSPLMSLYGLMGKYLGFGNDAILRILFLFPSLILSFLGPLYLTRYLKLSRTVQFFSVLTYLLNTYYILLVDGGQVGVALAYGIFPFAVLFLKKLVDESSKANFFKALLVSLAMCLVDPRIFAIAFSVVFIWGILEKKLSFPLFFLLLLVVGFNAYWILPLLKAGGFGVSPSIADLNLTSLVNPLLLFSPHWPNNIFGKITGPPFYFFFVPLLIFGSLLSDRRNKNLIFMFLIFSVLSTIPLGFVFRDPTKFFMPVVLFAGILIGATLDKKSYILRLISYLYILLLVLPALTGKLNFLLSNHRPDPSHEVIHQELVKDSGEFRTLWFTQKHPLSFETRQKPAIDGRDLANFRPFAAMNASEDVFNFLNNPRFVDWLKVLGIKYVFLSGDARNLFPTETDVKNWETIQGLVGKTDGLGKKDWGTDFEVYETKGVYPGTFSVEKLMVVVGGDLALPAPAVYVEDGKWDPSVLLNKDPESVDVFFNGKDKLDLTMSFLQKYFVSAEKSVDNDWAYYSKDQYLKYKYELLIRGFEFRDFDYELGIAFSTKEGETVKFRFNVPADGKYILAKRIADEPGQNLSWEIQEKDLMKGIFDYEVTNDSNFAVLNVAAMASKEEFMRAQNSAEEMVSRVGLIRNEDPADLVISDEGWWAVTTSNYNPARGSLPVFSMVNGYYRGGEK